MEIKCCLSRSWTSPVLDFGHEISLHARTVEVIKLLKTLKDACNYMLVKMTPHEVDFW